MSTESKLFHQLVLSSNKTSLDPSLVEKIKKVIEEHEIQKEYIEIDEKKEFFDKYVLTNKCKKLSRNNRDKLRKIFKNIIINDKRKTIEREEIEKIFDTFDFLDCELEKEEKKLQQTIIYNFMIKHQNKI